LAQECGRPELPHNGILKGCLRRAMEAAAAERRRPPGRSSPAEVRFSDVAHYVGLSLLRDPSTIRSAPKARSRSAAPLESREPGPFASPQAELLSPELDKDPDLPPIRAGRTERLRCQLEWLRAEQRAEREQLQKLESCLSDSLLLEKKAQRRATKHREMRNFHQQRAADVEMKITKLKGEMEAQERALQQQRSRSMPISKSASTKDEHQQAGPVAEEQPHLQQSLQRTRHESEVRAAALQSRSPEASTGHRATPDVARSQEIGGTRAMSVAEFSSASGVSFMQALGPPARAPQEASQEEGEDSVAEDGALAASSGSQAKRAWSPHSSCFGASTATRASGMLDAHTLQPPREELYPQELAEIRREAVRKELIQAGGSERESFKKMDLNGSGNISSQDFADGVTRLGVKWPELTGLRRPRDLFKLFDQDKDGVITFAELFPNEEPREPKRPSTPEFVGYWIRNNRDVESMPVRDAKWQPSSPDEKLQRLLEAAQFRDEVNRKKRWMSSTIRRLKTRGKSDARCREIVALHLPRGTGPKDREDVPIFSQAEVRACKKAYTDSYMDPVKRIQKVVMNMKEQKRDVRTVREELYMVTEAKVMQQQAEDERKKIATSIAGISVLSKVKDPPQDDEGSHKTSSAQPISFNRIAEETGMDADQVGELYRDFLKFADSKEMLGHKGFSRLLQVLCPKRTLPDSDLDAWWEQLTKGQQSPDAQKAATGGRRCQCGFEEFAGWFASSEARIT